MKEMMFVFNPCSGREQIRGKLMGILDLFTKAGYDIHVHVTQRQGDCREWVKSHGAHMDMIVCSGGDGTLNEAISGMLCLDQCPLLGYIPSGSTNDFAQSLRIPKNMLKAADIAVNGRNYLCDIGTFNENYFVYIAAFGLFTDVSYQTSQNLKNVFGHGAYLLEGAKRLVDIPSYVMEVTVGDQVVTDEFVYGMITNSTSVGGIKNITGSDVELNDGLFEVNLIKMPQNPIQLNEIVTNLVRPKDAETPYIYSFKTDHIKLRCESQKIPWTLDGEFGGNHKEVEISIKNKAIKLKIR